MHLKYAFEFELALFHKKAFFSFFVICLIKTIWQVIKKGKIKESMNLILFSVVNTTSIQMIGSAPGSHGCAFHCGSVTVGWSSDCVHRHACH